MKHLGLILTVLLAAILPAGTVALDGGPYYGTNYTVPFAHAYRALDSLGVDHREAIGRDVYHMARLGLNAFRLHIWDVEISDSCGNLVENEHLRLLDELVDRLSERGISVILTAQTNFGNGYPERNSDPNGAFSYRFEKCRVHDDTLAQAAQERYLQALVSRPSSTTGVTLAANPAVIAIEINNEPCHSGTESEITAYIDRMSAAIRRAGWRKDILYNVSHNLWRTPAFYRAADVQGTTYQWYPTGLVHGSRRRGNFLPVLDNYHIPFDTVPGYDRMARIVYEYDPADVLETYLYPAAARSFRKAGFDWVTQFAYDPIDMARFNTEYQTHFLNLAYTPGKAVGMAVAAEVMRRLPKGFDPGKYPADTVFGCFTVSARRDLAMLNDGEKYYHTNSTDVAPAAPGRLKVIAGVGSSPLVTTDGTGAYFLDRLDSHTWRLEVMPDVVMVADPFARPSLSREVARIVDAPVAMSLRLPGLPAGFRYRGERGSGVAEGTEASFMPGVYLLSGSEKAFGRWPADKAYADGRLRVGEYAMPPVSGDPQPALAHEAAAVVAEGRPLVLKAVVAGAVDSVKVYPASADFWNDHNTLYAMAKSGKYEYSVEIDPAEISKKDRFDYRIVVYRGADAVTYPSETDGTPLDWDFGAGIGSTSCYSTAVRRIGAPLVLLDGSRGADGAEVSSIPEAWGSISMHTRRGELFGVPAVTVACGDSAVSVDVVTLGKYVRPLIEASGDPVSQIGLALGRVEGVDSVDVSVCTTDGFTYRQRVSVSSGGRPVVSLDALRPGPTLLNPAPYPSFLQRSFEPDPQHVPALNPADIESFIIAIPSPKGVFSLEVAGVWMQ